jgi:hypothetical protein
MPLVSSPPMGSSAGASLPTDQMSYATCLRCSIPSFALFVLSFFDAAGSSNCAVSRYFGFTCALS